MVVSLGGVPSACRGAAFSGAAFLRCFSAGAVPLLLLQQPSAQRELVSVEPFRACSRKSGS
ncbi:hypothetical protein DUI70_3878 [Streptomyces albus]|nr:hypothetical protein SLNHY_3946 [Streptomyces albus]AYN34378.1 hypothetical protein DUI70_3878 [Streptomyces albus]